MGDASRAAAQCEAEMLVSVGELFALRLRESGECEDYAVDTYAAVAAQVAATLRVSAAMGSSHLKYALAMRQRLPQVGKAFEAGAINYDTFKTIVFRTALITDPDRLARADAHLALAATRWVSMSRGKLDKAIDKAVHRVDPDAVRRRTEDAAADRCVEIYETEGGYAEMHARVFDTTGRLLNKRLDELAATVCDADPRTREQRRGDAFEALVVQADRMPCQCGLPACPVAGLPIRASGVTIHVVAERATLDGTCDAPAVTMGAQDLVPAEVVREMAALAKTVPIIAPVDTAPEPKHDPTTALANYVRFRDMTCRAPGCDHPAVNCDLDHTIPWADGGATHASNLACLCRLHHLLKTFWGWHSEQLPDGTVIWTLPGNQRMVTTPGSALLFPQLCVPTGVLPAPTKQDRADHGGGDRMAKMPRRTRTRRQNQASAIAAERKLNRDVRLASRAEVIELLSPHDEPDDGSDPAPF